MPHYYCPCGSVVAEGSSARSLKSPCLRLFMSIRTMKCVSPEDKVCNACRGAYYTWKNKNSEFNNIFSRIEQELSDVEGVINTNSVNKSFFFFK
jgi:hypothetical protein